MNRRSFLSWLAALPALLLVKPSAAKAAPYVVSIDRASKPDSTIGYVYGYCRTSNGAVTWAGKPWYRITGPHTTTICDSYGTGTTTIVNMDDDDQQPQHARL